MFHVDCETGRPVRIGYIHAKFVMTKRDIETHDDQPQRSSLEF